MNDDTPKSDCVRFTPKAVEGLPDVTDVAIFSDRLEVETSERQMVFPYQSFAKAVPSFELPEWRGKFHRPFLALVVAECKIRAECPYVHFFTTPELTIYAPPESEGPVRESYLERIVDVLMSGGWFTYNDLA